LLVLFAAVVVSVVAYVYWVDLLFFVGSLFFVHWLGLAAILFIITFVPIYYFVKRKRPKKIKTLLRVHVFGNLLSFLFVSVHFAQNTGRLSGFPLRLEEGFVLFGVLSLIVATGVFERFGPKGKLVKFIRPVHRYTVAVLYLIVIVHTLQGFHII
jgi:hypothetical protein